MTGYAFPDMLVELDALHRGGRSATRRTTCSTLHLPLIRYEQQPGIGLAVRKYVLMRRGIIASRHAAQARAALSATARAEVDYLLQRLARHDPRAAL